MLRELGYPSDLAHRSADQIWARVESLLQRKGIFLICFDEFQHFAHEKNAAQLRSILDSLKDLMKRSEWPIMPIVTGVPRLAEILNHSTELTARLEPAKFEDIDYDEASIEEIDGIVVQYADLAGVDVSRVRDEEIYRRMIHACLRRWGRLIEMVIHTFAFAQVQGQMEIDKTCFVRISRRLSRGGLVLRTVRTPSWSQALTGSTSPNCCRADRTQIAQNITRDGNIAGFLLSGPKWFGISKLAIRISEFGNTLKISY